MFFSYVIIRWLAKYNSHNIMFFALNDSVIAGCRLASFFSSQWSDNIPTLVCVIAISNFQNEKPIPHTRRGHVSLLCIHERVPVSCDLTVVCRLSWGSVIFRSFIFPPYIPGFKRDKKHWTLFQDQLLLAPCSTDLPLVFYGRCRKSLPSSSNRRKLRPHNFITGE